MQLLYQIIWLYVFPELFHWTVVRNVWQRVWVWESCLFFLPIMGIMFNHAFIYFSYILLHQYSYSQFLHFRKLIEWDSMNRAWDVLNSTPFCALRNHILLLSNVSCDTFTGLWILVYTYIHPPLHLLLVIQIGQVADLHDGLL